jgi:hypothetical protein
MISERWVKTARKSGKKLLSANVDDHGCLPNPVYLVLRIVNTDKGATLPVYHEGFAVRRETCMRATGISMNAV